MVLLEGRRDLGVKLAASVWGPERHAPSAAPPPKPKDRASQEMGNDAQPTAKDVCGCPLPDTHRRHCKFMALGWGQRLPEVKVRQGKELLLLDLGVGREVSTSWRGRAAPSPGGSAAQKTLRKEGPPQSEQSRMSLSEGEGSRGDWDWDAPDGSGRSNSTCVGRWVPEARACGAGATLMP